MSAAVSQSFLATATIAPTLVRNPTSEEENPLPSLHGAGLRISISFVSSASLVKYQSFSLCDMEYLNGGEKPWRWAEGWWAVKKCSARLFSC
jgi:hypothetical protein